jgi:hypothetical protein
LQGCSAYKTLLIWKLQRDGHRRDMSARTTRGMNLTRSPNWLLQAGKLDW